MSQSDWDMYIGKEVRLLIEDSPFPRPRDGIVTKATNTHLFLQVKGKQLPVPFLISTIRRIDVKEEQDGH